MKRMLIASLAALSVVAAPAMATTTSTKPAANVTKSQKKKERSIIESSRDGKRRSLRHLRFAQCLVSAK